MKRTVETDSLIKIGGQSKQICTNQIGANIDSNRRNEQSQHTSIAEDIKTKIKKEN